MPAETVNYRSEALGAFAHEFRTPLTAIKMVMELGRRSAEGEAIHLDPEVAAMLEESMDNLEELADGIQALSWLERGKLNLESGPCDLAAVFGQV
ncbi:MAG: HAMP domain-containing histidine kinase, partial [Dehalococcoidia bacterium]|nr:HAMP domain-containing histidine kinase [Dehalococcoidia bacterium]